MTRITGSAPVTCERAPVMAVMLCGCDVVVATIVGLWVVMAVIVIFVMVKIKMEFV